MLGRVHPELACFPRRHSDRDSILDETKLLKAFRLFKRGGTPSSELKQDLPPIGIDANVSFEWFAPLVSSKRNPVTAEVERVAGKVRDNLNHGGIFHIGRIARAEDAGHRDL